MYMLVLCAGLQSMEQVSAVLRQFENEVDGAFAGGHMFWQRIRQQHDGGGTAAGVQERPDGTAGVQGLPDGTSGVQGRPSPDDARGTAEATPAAGSPRSEAALEGGERVSSSGAKRSR